MRIALVTHNVHRHGGVPLYVAALATALAPGHKVTIFSSGCEDVEDSGVRHRTVRALGSRGFIHLLTFSLASSLLLSLSRLKQAGRWDIIHAHNYDCAALANVITSHFCEGEGYDQLLHQGSGVTLGELLQRKIRALLESGLVRQSRRKPIIVLSQRMKREFLSHYASMEDRLPVILSGVDSTRYSPANTLLYRDETRCRHSVAMTDTLVLFVGGYWERKGLSQVIKALPRLRSSQVTLLVVGSGDATRYRKLARNEGVKQRVIFAGPVEEVWKYYAAADIFLLPSLYEPFGLCILEAMATGLPVVTSREAGVAELIHDGFDALLLEDAGDVADIAAKLDLLVEDVDLRRRLGERARQTAMGYTWSRVAQSTVDVYQQVLTARRN